MEQDKGIDFAAGVSPALKLEIDGKEYELAPAKVGHLALVQKRAREDARKQAEEDMSILRAAGDMLESRERLEMVREMIQVDMSWMTYILTPDGLRYMLYLRLKPNFSDMTEEQVGDLVTMDALAQLSDELTDVLGIDAFLTEEGEGDARPPETQEQSEEPK
jgi:hypothetical protein